MQRKFFNHGHIRTSISIFGYLFNKIYIARFSDDGKHIDSLFHVPILHVSRSRIFQNSNLTPTKNPGDEDSYRKFFSVFPRIGFEFKGMSYDSSRQFAKDLYAKFGKKYGKVPAPYVLDFTMTVVARDQTSAVMVIEQILPYFKPNLTVEYSDEVFDQPSEITLHIGDISLVDNYADQSSQRMVSYDISFTMTMNYWPYVVGADIELSKFVECGGKVDVPIDENWPYDDGSDPVDSTLIEKVIIDSHDIGVWPSWWPTLERTVITGTPDDPVITSTTNPEGPVPTLPEEA